jgi:hypothetical protein
VEHQLTTAPQNHILTSANIWSPDGQWIVYDIRSDRHGSVFDGDRIEQVNVETGEIQLLYQSKNGAKCGVATYSPTQSKVIFILGPESPTPDWQYGPSRRQGVIVDTSNPGVAIPLDARNLTAPFTPGALRGGSHLHLFSPDGQWVSFTYNDDVAHSQQRNIGISLPGRAVKVPPTHPRNHEGEGFSVLVTRTQASPKRGLDEIRRAFEEAWIGTNGYLKPGGSRQKRALAFQGEVITDRGQPISEVFVVDLPDDPTLPGNDPIEGAVTDLPAPPAGITQRRLTFTAAHSFPGLSGPRHWLRSSPDGGKIACLMHDDRGIVQIFLISPNGGEVSQLTRNPWPIASAFTWSPDGQSIVHLMDESLFITDAITGASRRCTPKNHDGPLPEACVFSPDGSKVAYLRPVGGRNQIFLTRIDICPIR